MRQKKGKGERGRRKGSGRGFHRKNRNGWRWEQKKEQKRAGKRRRPGVKKQEEKRKTFLLLVSPPPPSHLNKVGKVHRAEKRGGEENEKQKWWACGEEGGRKRGRKAPQFSPAHRYSERRSVGRPFGGGGGGCGHICVCCAGGGVVLLFFDPPQNKPS